VARPRIRDNFDFGGTEAGVEATPVMRIAPVQRAVRTGDGVARQSRILQQHEMELIRRTLGMSVLEDSAKISAIVDAMDAIREQTGKILRSGVQIGREMIALLDQLSADEGQRVVRSGSELFAGWTSGNLTKMIGAARLFDSGWVDKSLLPTSYTVLYQLSQLDRPLLEHAVERDLIHPELSRTQVEQLRRTITIAAKPDAGQTDRATPPETPIELTRIDARLAELRREILTLSSRRRKLILSLRRTSPKGA